jgi:hypothetical protein
MKMQVQLPPERECCLSTMPFRVNQHHNIAPRSRRATGRAKLVFHLNIHRPVSSTSRRNQAAD